jgi:hypothetical protein
MKMAELDVERKQFPAPKNCFECPYINTKILSHAATKKHNCFCEDNREWVDKYIQGDLRHPSCRLKIIDIPNLNSSRPNRPLQSDEEYAIYDATGLVSQGSKEDIDFLWNKITMKEETFNLHGEIYLVQIVAIKEVL